METLVYEVDNSPAGKMGKMNGKVPTAPGGETQRGVRERVTFIDGSNLYFSQKQVGRRLSLSFLEKLAKEGAERWKVFFFNSVSPEKGNHGKFLELLKRRGFTVVSPSGFPYSKKGGEKGIDVLITSYLLKEVNGEGGEGKEILLVSGDGDFAPVLEEVKGKGVKVLVASFQGSLSRALVEVADEVILL